jgi:hypothetical protein
MRQEQVLTFSHEVWLRVVTHIPTIQPPLEAGRVAEAQLEPRLFHRQRIHQVCPGVRFVEECKCLVKAALGLSVLTPDPEHTCQDCQSRHSPTDVAELLAELRPRGSVLESGVEPSLLQAASARPTRAMPRAGTLAPGYMWCN